MNIIKQSALPILEKDFYKKIERCGRVCYKSEDRITDDSAQLVSAGLKLQLKK